MEKLVLETVQWSALLDIDDVKPLKDEDYQVLEKIGAVLKLYGYEERFGVCLLHKHFDLAANEKLVEETDVENRLLITKVSDNTKEELDTIETMWRFPKGIEAAVECVKVCDYNNGHKMRHQIVGR